MIQLVLIPQPATFQCLGQSSTAALQEVQAIPLVLGPVAQFVCGTSRYFKSFHKHWRSEVVEGLLPRNQIFFYLVCSRASLVISSCCYYCVLFLGRELVIQGKEFKLICKQPTRLHTEISSA